MKKYLNLFRITIKLILQLIFKSIYSNCIFLHIFNIYKKILAIKEISNPFILIPAILHLQTFFLSKITIKFVSSYFALSLNNGRLKFLNNCRYFVHRPTIYSVVTILSNIFNIGIVY